MFNFDVFVELSFILLIIFHTHGQKFLKDDDICGLTKKQIQEALSHSLKYSVNGIAINSDCLEGQNINNDQCLKEQSKLIECLQREYVLTKGNFKRFHTVAFVVLIFTHLPSIQPTRFHKNVQR